MLVILAPQAATRLPACRMPLIRPEDLQAGRPGSRGARRRVFCLPCPTAPARGGRGAPFAAGIDHVLPPARSRDPRSGASVVLIAVQTVIVALIVVLSWCRRHLKSVSTTRGHERPFRHPAIPVPVRRVPHGAGQGRDRALRPRRPLARAAGPRAASAVGVAGATATIVAVLCTLVPSPDARNQLRRRPSRCVRLRGPDRFRRRRPPPRQAPRRLLEVGRRPLSSCSRRGG